MQIPLNILHDYIGIIVLGPLAIDLLLRNRRHPNTTTFELGLATLCATITTMAYGIPVLFSQQPRIISMGTFVGDLMQTSAMLFMWFIVIRASLGTKPKVMHGATVLVVLLAMVSMAEALYRNLTPPYSTNILNRANGSIAIVYTDSGLYQLLNGINSLALLALGLYFLKEAKRATLRSQRLRIRGIASGFIVGSSAFLFTSAFPVDKQLLFSASVLLIAFLIIAVVGVISLRMMAVEKKAMPQTADTVA